MNDAKAAVVTACRTVLDDALRDVWVFDRTDHEALFVRDDVAATLEDVTVEDYIDKERYGYVTRDTYEELYYADYRYTVRGFDAFQQVRLFLPPDDGVRIGLLVSVDNDDRPVAFDDLYGRVRSVGETEPADALLPSSGSHGSKIGPKESV